MEEMREDDALLNEADGLFMCAHGQRVPQTRALFVDEATGHTCHNNSWRTQQSPGI